MKAQNQEGTFERELQDKADGFGLEPSGLVWNHIEASIRRRSRRKIMWWSSVAFMILAVGTGMFFLMQRNQQSPEQALSAQRSKVDEAAHDQSPEDRMVPRDKSAVAIQPVHVEDKSNSKHFVSDAAEAGDHSSESSAVMKDELTPEMGIDNREYVDFLVNETTRLDDKRYVSVSGPVEKQTFNESSYVNIEEVMAKRFAIEGDGMPLATYSWNKETGTGTSAMSQSQMTANSFWLAEGYSLGFNLHFHPARSWFLGTGMHFTSTASQIAFPGQTLMVLDTSYTTINSTVYTTIDTTYVTYQPTEKLSQNWIDVSLVAGSDLFPYSKNHLRLAGGVAYSRLLEAKSEMQPPSSAEVFDNMTAGSFAGGSVSPDAFSRNQLQLQVEASYVRDIGARFSLVAGGQIHYYPFNLFSSQEITQHMLWLGLKAGVQFSF
jgi:hypothetical protein